MNDTDRLSITFSTVIGYYRRMLRMWQTIAFLLLILSLMLSSCIMRVVYDNELQFRPSLGMTATMIVAGRLLKSVNKENRLCTA